MNLNLKFCVSVGTEYIAYFSEGDVDVDKGSGDGGGGGGSFDRLIFKVLRALSGKNENSKWRPKWKSSSVISVHHLRVLWTVNALSYHLFLVF